MPNLPAANVSLSELENALANGTGYLAVLACVAQNATDAPAVYTSTAALLSRFNYAPGVAYCARHFADANTPVLFCPLPVATAGAISYQNNTGVTGTASITAAATSSGSIMEAVQGIATVTKGTTVGTDQIALTLSLDNGETDINVRLGTASSYVIPYIGVTLTFGAGTLNVGDVFTFGTTAPMWNNAGIQAALTALAAQEQTTRSWLVVGDVSTVGLANDILTAANEYASADDRFVYARAQVTDFCPLATKSQVSAKMTGSPSLTFAASGHTITRATGSWITDGFVTGDIVSVSGSVDNNGVIGACTVTSATVLTFASGPVNETVTTASVSGSESVVFAAGDTITRGVGSWITDGFAIGQTVTVAGSALNSGTGIVITGLTATVLTASASTFSAQTDPGASISVTEVQNQAGWVAAQTSAFATVDASPRIDLGYGRARCPDQITGYTFRRPCQWAVSIREYQHDVQIPTYRKDDGPLVNFTLTDDNGVKKEYDERLDGGALAGRFTCLRSYGNGPRGAFVALSLTRDTEGALLSRTHNMAVACLAEAVVQAETENAIGQVLELNDDGTATSASLGQIQERVNTQLQINLLEQFKEGPRASSATWTANTTDILNTPGAPLTGVLALNLNGTLEQINTSVNVS